MHKVLRGALVALSALVLAAGVVAPARAQAADTKEKPPMYSYVGLWNIPRAQWDEMEKTDATNQKILDKAIADGTLVAYGNDRNLVHQPDGYTHDDWWSAMSMAGVLNVLDQFHKAGTSTTNVLQSATKHADGINVSRHYNWRAGSWKDAYTHGGYYKLKPTAPDDALETLSKNLLVPFFEKLLADGTIVEYEIDTEAIHTEAPGAFWLFYLTPNATSLDKVNSALQDWMKSNPFGGAAWASVVDDSGHRDYLTRTTATFK